MDHHKAVVVAAAVTAAVAAAAVAIAAEVQCSQPQQWAEGS